MTATTAQVEQLVEQHSQGVRSLLAAVEQVIVGQRPMVERLVIGLLTGGHILIEGVPGLAKTLAVSTLARAILAQFSRIQFTPDLLPSDLVGTLIYNPRDGSFTPRKGPIFANIILADEINRAPAKVQSALLEAMQERQVTIGEHTYPLADPFLVLATQNPIEQEGTYQLPEAQVDRFMLKLRVDYPSKDEERRIVDRMASTHPATTITPVVQVSDILAARAVVDQVYIDDRVKDYIVEVVHTTRRPAGLAINGIELGRMIEFGASPRASINLVLAAKAHAFLKGRGYVTPADIKAIGMDVLRHRVITSYEAQAEGVTAERIVQEIFDHAPVP
jgi:MoxR-like ATPase